jgi:hypothetical protein
MLTPLAEEERGASLFHECQADIRNMDSSDRGSDLDRQTAERCLDYFSGFIDASVMIPNRLYCLEDSASIGTLIRIYVKHMEANPKLLDQYRSVGLADALVTNYPCAKPKGS